MRPAALVTVLLTLLATAGCLSCRDNLVSLEHADGSNDHRIFRLASVTQVMMEPVLWRLEDDGLVSFRRPVTDYLWNPLPPEFTNVTLRALHDNTSGLPRDLLDLWCLGDIGTALACAVAGTDPYAGFSDRSEFVRRLWEPRIRGMVRNGSPGKSNVGYALMMMAICDHLGTTPQALCEKYLIEPYGLKDTSFEPAVGMLPRVARPCAGTFPLALPAGLEVDDHRVGDVTVMSRGMLSSASDVLKVCYVILPHLQRAKGVLDARTLDCGHEALYRDGAIGGGYAFVGFDPVDRHAVVVLENGTRWSSGRGFEVLDELVRPPTDD